MFHKLITKLGCLIAIPLIVGSLSFKTNNNLNKNYGNKIPEKQLTAFNHNSEKLNNKIDINAINWLWKAPYQEVKRYTEDFSLSEISSGWYEAGTTFFNEIEVKFDKENYTKKFLLTLIIVIQKRM